MALMALYHPPVQLRKRHKDLLKTAWSFRQGYDGSKLKREFCRFVGGFASITVHHQDNTEGHNDPDNLCPVGRATARRGTLSDYAKEPRWHR